VVATIDRESPALVIVDSIQTVFDPSVEATPGSVSQVRGAAARLMRLAKDSGVPIFLVGHVTKEGAIAGPRVLEHMVDTVLYLEGERGQEVRILRATKNRFGSTEEIGLFAMTEQGMEELRDPSAILMGDLRSVPGAVVLAAMEGTRPLLVEVQSLVSKSAFQLPRRAANGMDLNRLHLLVAVLEKRAGLQLRESDVFVNAAGGVRLTEPAADLALALTLASNVRNRPAGSDLVAIGELGLSGEVRRVRQLERRLLEACRMGFKRAVVPADSEISAGNLRGLKLLRVATVLDAIGLCFNGG
jgi:DNA repair protein RadA/Sms